MRRKSIARIPMAAILAAYRPELSNYKDEDLLIPVVTYKRVDKNNLRWNVTARTMNKRVAETRKDRERKQASGYGHRRYHCCMSGCGQVLARKNLILRHLIARHQVSEKEALLAYKNVSEMDRCSQKMGGSCMRCLKAVGNEAAK